MTRNGAAVVVEPAAHGRIELRLIDAGELVGRVTLSCRQTGSLVLRLQMVAAQVTARKHADQEPLERSALG